jgi:hypothetical protein
MKVAAPRDHFRINGFEARLDVGGTRAGNLRGGQRHP